MRHPAYGSGQGVVISGLMVKCDQFVDVAMIIKSSG